MEGWEAIHVREVIGIFLQLKEWIWSVPWLDLMMKDAETLSLGLKDGAPGTGEPEGGCFLLWTACSNHQQEMRLL